MEDVVGRKKTTKKRSERNEIEEALRESEDKRRFILKDIEEAYYETDMIGKFTFINDAMCHLIGYTREELIGKRYWHLVDETTIRTLKDAVDKSYKTVNILDMEATRKDGTKLIFETSISVIRDIEGTLIGFRGISRDVTKRRQMEYALRMNQEELIKKNKEIDESREKIQLALEKFGKTHEELKASQLKILQQEKMASIGQLAAGVAHEINNPLAFISSNLGTLDKYINKLIDFIQTQSEGIESLQQQMLLEQLRKNEKN